MEYGEVSRFFFALALVVGLIWLLAYGVRRSGLDKKFRGIGGGSGRLSVTDVLYLDPKRKLLLVKVDAREYILLVSGDAVTVIDKLGAGHETA